LPTVRKKTASEKKKTYPMENQTGGEGGPKPGGGWGKEVKRDETSLHKFASNKNWVKAESTGQGTCKDKLKEKSSVIGRKDTTKQKGYDEKSKLTRTPL